MHQGIGPRTLSNLSAALQWGAAAAVAAAAANPWGPIATDVSQPMNTLPIGVFLLKTCKNSLKAPRSSIAPTRSTACLAACPGHAETGAAWRSCEHRVGH
jgi:hypothetical protein